MSLLIGSRLDIDPMGDFQPLAQLYAPVSKGGRPGFDGILLLKLLLLEHPMGDFQPLVWLE